jgi:2-polyprenyl-3-methyl-5-hydroxy-6-metoxy-1,4-benzoquinol methylase
MNTPTGESSYTDEYLRQYHGGDFEPLLVAVRRLELLKSTARYEHQRILEIGCALEPLYPFLDQFDGYTIVEASKEMAQTVAAKAAEVPSVTVINATIENVANALGRDFDWIICSSVLHEVPDPVAFLSAVRSVCNAGTVCHFSVPNAMSFHRLLAVEMGLIERMDDLSERDHRFGHGGVFQRDSLRALLHDCGFRVVRDGTFFIKPFTHEQMHRLLTERILPQVAVDGLYRLSRYFPDHGCELFAEAVATQ